ncbi:hypothetical protein DPMN_060895 [Dreissena polymorpha]|uniref:Uncharacterized protein n=1 Tax=Dreissena polymorpha TaxID=45954 RepID=A0A9D4C6R2_DREPO|nr:hypothetical protein DPMN_060895 [Dreissena polymorpha]
MYYFDRCVADMCRLDKDIVYTPMCTLTSAVTQQCADYHYYLDWNFNEYTTMCSKSGFTCCCIFKIPHTT